jgi:hypothetical protein
MLEQVTMLCPDNCDYTHTSSSGSSSLTRFRRVAVLPLAFGASESEAESTYLGGSLGACRVDLRVMAIVSAMWFG